MSGSAVSECSQDGEFVFYANPLFFKSSDFLQDIGKAHGLAQIFVGAGGKARLHFFGLRLGGQK